MSSFFKIADITEMPFTPVAKTDLAFSLFMPPIATEGIVIFSVISLKPASPIGSSIS